MMISPSQLVRKYAKILYGLQELPGAPLTLQFTHAGIRRAYQQQLIDSCIGTRHSQDYTVKEFFHIQFIAPVVHGVCNFRIQHPVTICFILI